MNYLSLSRRYFFLPNIKSAKKRVKVAEKKTLRNQMIKSQVKTLIKKFENSLKEDQTSSPELFKNVVKKLDQAQSKGILKKNAVSRKKSQLAKHLNASSEKIS